MTTIAIPASTIVTAKAVARALSTHPDLSDSDVAFGVSYVSSLPLTSDQLALILLMMSRNTNTGRFALSFNHELDNALILRDTDILSALLTKDPANFFVELYDNQELTDLERQTVENMVRRELEAMKATVQYATVLSLDGALEEVELFTGSQETLYSRCYGDVCVAETSDVMNGGSDIPQIVYAVDQVGDESPIAYVFDYMDLIAALSTDQAINPATQQPFSSIAQRELGQRYAKEIKMYRRYLEQLQRAVSQ